MEFRIPIRNYNLPNSPRIFDVIYNETGEILGIEVKNIRGCLSIPFSEVLKQIKNELSKK